MTKGFAACLSLAICIVSFGSAPAAADTTRHLGVHGGLFNPWIGNPGFSVAAQFGVSMGERSSIGGEFEYRDFEGELFNIKEIDSRAFNFRAIYRYDVLVDHRVTPYIGAGASLVVNTFDRDKIERTLEAEHPGTRVKVPVASVGAGIMGMLGAEVRIPGNEHLRLFAEGRLELSAQISPLKSSSDAIDDFGVDKLGGVSVTGGVRWAF